MDTSKVEITITGQSGVGKTTISAIVERALEDNGYPVINKCVPLEMDEASYPVDKEYSKYVHINMSEEVS